MIFIQLEWVAMFHYEIRTTAPVYVKHPCGLGLGLPYPCPIRASTGWTEPFL
jgi:hypothetical protein